MSDGRVEPSSFPTVSTMPREMCVNRLAAGRFADKALSTPSVLGYPFFTRLCGVV